MSSDSDVLLLGQDDTSLPDASGQGSRSGDDTENKTPAQEQTRDTSPQQVSVETVQLTESQYAEITNYMSTQLYVSLAIFAAVAITMGMIVAQCVLSHWRV